MKVSLELKSFVDKQCRFYCNQLGLSEPPLIIYDIDELQGTYPQKTLNEMKKSDGARSWTRGNLDIDQDLVWLNVEDGTDFLWQITDFLVHELVHIRFPNLEHGDEFQNTINSIIMGKRF